MPRRLLLCLALTGCTRSSTTVGPYVTRLQIVDSALVVDRCTITDAPRDQSGAIVGAIIAAALTGGRSGGGGRDTRHDLHLSDCTQTQQPIDVLP